MPITLPSFSNLNKIPAWDDFNWNLTSLISIFLAPSLSAVAANALSTSSAKANAEMQQVRNGVTLRPTLLLSHTAAF